MGKTVLVGLILSLLSCSRSSQPHTIETELVADLKAELREEEPDTKALRQAYIKDYGKVVVLDSTYQNKKGQLIRLHYKYYCLFDSGVVIPGRHVWEDTTSNFLTHNYAADVSITLAGDTVFNETINKDRFRSILAREYEELQRYAVMMHPVYRGFDRENEKFTFHYSISIPITDVGVGLTQSIGLNGKIETEEP